MAVDGGGWEWMGMCGSGSRQEWVGIGGTG